MTNYVIKRNGSKADFDIQKIRDIINYACEGLDIQPIKLEASITKKFKDNIKTEDIQDELIITSASLASVDEPEWIIVSGRLIIYNLQRNIYKKTKLDYNVDFKDVMRYMTTNGYYDKSIYKYYDEEDFSLLTKHIIVDNDKDNTIASASSLIKKYLIKNNLGPVELPQHADMAISLFLNKYNDSKDRMKEVIEEYKLISNKVISLATPFKSNLRKKDGNLSSCFIVEVDDNIESIMKTYKDIAQISKNGGGVGVYLSRIRPSNALIRNVSSANNICLWNKIISDIAVACNQLGSRAGAITVAVDIWYKDLLDFIQLKTEVGDLRFKAFNLFPQVVVSDIFMKRLKEDKEWYLLDHTEVLSKLKIDILVPKVLENNFNLIEEAVKSKKLKNIHIVKAKDVWKEMLKVYVETGDLYIVHKDNMNKMNPVYKNDMYIQSANLCLDGESIINIITDDKEGIQEVKISDLENYSNYKVLCRDTKNKFNKWEKGYGFTKSIHNKLYKITDLSTGLYVKCSANHKIWTENRGYVEASELKENDELKTEKNIKSDKGLEIEVIEGTFTLYDINVENVHNFYANGILVHNCVESYSPILHSKNYKTEVIDNKVMETFDMGFSHTCNLVSLNLTKILNDEKLLEKACRYSVRMLDKAIDVTTTPIPESNKHNQMFRTIGVCSMGLADWMAYNKLSYHKEEDWIKVEELYEKIAYYTLDESCNIAQEKGSFLEFENSYFKDGIILGRTLEENKAISKTNLNWDAIHEKVKLGVRNMFITAIAPTSSTAVLLNSSASYLPVFNKFYFESMNKMNIPVAPKFIKNRFWFYNEGFTVPTEKIVKLTSKIQKWVDCGISMELIINPSLTNIKKISDSIIEGFDEGLKTVYYSRTIEIDENGNKSENGKEIGCVSCAN